MHRHRHSGTGAAGSGAHHSSSGSTKLVAPASPSRRCLPSPPLAGETRCCLCRGTSPRMPLAGSLPLCLSLLPFLCLFPFPSASQRTWALSFSTPEAGVRFYNVDPLQKARSICLISWRSLDSSIACCLCSCINHRALPRSEGQSSAISTLNLTSNYINRYLSPPWWRQRALKWKGFLWLVHWQKFLNEIIQVWETYWPLTMIGQINTRKEAQSGKREKRWGERPITTGLPGKWPLFRGEIWTPPDAPPPPPNCFVRLSSQGAFQCVK